MEPNVVIKIELRAVDIREVTLNGIYTTERITPEIAKEVGSKRLAFTNLKAYPDKEIGFEEVKASAIASKSVFRAFLANFFIKIHVIRSKVPVWVLGSEEKAFDWFKGFIN